MEGVMAETIVRALDSYFPRSGTSTAPTAWDQLHTNYDDVAAIAAVGGIIAGRYAEAAGYSKAIVDAFYAPAGLPKEDAPPYRTALTQSDRERCLIALLVSQGETLTLALHIYLALMLEVSPAEIGHIIFLTGVYSGASRYADALLVAGDTLQLLENLAPSTPTPADVVKQIQTRFPVGTSGR
jgi:alkylhydroperoxidase/carboxymuconolactone decarboxylase family protein YurZ